MIDPIKLEHFRNLVSMAAADGVIDEVERVALSKIAFELGVPLERLNIMLSKAHEYVFIIPQNQQEKENQLQQMVELAHLDGDFSPAERELIKTVAERLNISKEELDKIIAMHIL